jgi:hypothetical protein
VWKRADSTYETNDDNRGNNERGRRVVTAAARPHIFWVGEDRESQELVRGWPVGPALLETLGSLNAEVREALAAERARLIEHGYPDDLSLPALWWKPRAHAALVEVAGALA